MNYNESGSGYSLSDIAAVTGRNNNNDGFGDGNGCWWIILFLIFAMGGWNNGGFGGGFGGDNMYPWLSNGQKEIMQNTNQGFNTLQLGNQLNDVSNGVQNISTQLCNGFAGVNQTVSSGFANAESSANARQMANMNQNFANQTAMLQGFNQISSQFADCCCENRLANCQTQNIIQNEGNATRFADANNTRDIIESQNRNSQAILDKLCQLELDNVKAQLEAKNDIIGQLRQENLYARGQASQVAQTAELRTSQATTANQLVNELRSCPIPSQPVYGNQPIFNCSPSWGNNGCGCNGNF